MRSRADERAVGKHEVVGLDARGRGDTHAARRPDHEAYTMERTGDVPTPRS